MAATDAASYKARKEAFVSNLSGSSVSDIFLTTLVAPAAVFLWSSLQRRQSFFTPYGPAGVAADFLLNVCATLFAITLYSSAPLFLNLCLLVPALLLHFLAQSDEDRSNDSTTTPRTRRRPTRQAKSGAPNHESVTSQAWRLVRRPFLTHYRGAMLIATVLAILAVDFPIFPRRFAKVETWGTSIMDLGVGMFVFSAGVVSARSLYGDGAAGTARRGLSARLFASIRHAAPLFALGVVRLISVKGLDYAEHVTEYGVHWNFFFTLGLLPPFVELADSLPVRKSALKYNVIALVIAALYEVVLDNTALLSYVLTAPRGPDLLSKNREGVFSFIGYLAIFLAGRATGTEVIGFLDIAYVKSPKPSTEAQVTARERSLILSGLAIDSAVWIGLYTMSTYYYGLNLVVSRRLANLPYILGVVAFNNAQIFLFGLVESYGPSFSYARDDKAKLDQASSKVMLAFNQNGLTIFLIANLLTGFVNLTFNTLDMSNIGAMGVLIAYAASVAALALGLNYTGVKLKL